MCACKRIHARFMYTLISVLWFRSTWSGVHWRDMKQPFARRGSIDVVPGPRPLDLHSGKLYWVLKSGLMAVAPPLEHDASCDVAIIGSGVTGALVADELARRGLEVIVLDRRDLAQGSTAASTALLQYDIDVPLYKLRGLIEPSRADRAYHLGMEAIETLGRLASEVAAPFERRPSLYFARTSRGLESLRLEFAARTDAKLAVEWLGPRELRGEYGQVSLGAIRSKVAAVTDPYVLCHLLLRRAHERGARIHDRTAVLKHRETDRGVHLWLEGGVKVRARTLVHASGFEASTHIPKGLVDLHSTYAMISEPIETPRAQWRDRALMWERNDPYLYVRRADDRIVVGGEDEPFADDERRDRLIALKTRRLSQKFARLFPDIQLRPAFAWAGTFGSTKDGLGYIGPLSARSRVLFALGFGGNGITYGTLASRILADRICGIPNKDAEIFGFSRAGIGVR